MRSIVPPSRVVFIHKGDIANAPETPAREHFLLGQEAIKPVAGHIRTDKVLSPAAISGPTEKERKTAYFEV
jgi:hypothetical protein